MVFVPVRSTDPNGDCSIKQLKIDHLYLHIVAAIEVGRLFAMRPVMDVSVTESKPPSPKVPAPNPAAESEASGRMRGVRVLVVEDDPSNARMLTAVFGAEGAAVRVARSGEEALEVLQGFAADVAVIDLALPSMSGLVLGRYLHAQPETERLVTIAVSALNGPRTERLALQSGFVAFLRKPIDIDELVAVTAAHLRERA